MRPHEEGEAADRRPARLEGAEGASRRAGNIEGSPLREVQEDLPIYSASPDDGDDRSSGVWASMGADAILRDDAQFLANVADVSADSIQRELGVVTRNAETNTKSHEIQMAEVLRNDGSIRAGPPTGNQYHRQKEEEAWLRTSTTGTPSHTPSSLMEGLMRKTPHFGHAPVARVEGSVASPLLLSQRMTLSSVASNGSKTRLTGRKRSCMTSEAYDHREGTYDMSRNAEMDVFDFMHAIGQATPWKSAIPSEEIRMLRGELLTEEMWELAEGLREQDLVAIAEGIIDTVYVLVGMALAYGLPFSDLWDEVHKNNMKKVGKSAFRADGKRLKPANFTGPDIAGVLKGDVA